MRSILAIAKLNLHITQTETYIQYGFISTQFHFNLNNIYMHISYLYMLQYYQNAYDIINHIMSIFYMK